METSSIPVSRRFKPYPSYKDSGVEWLGKIPLHWGISRVSEMVQLINGFPFDSQYFTKTEGTPLIRIRDLDSAETEANYVGPIIDAAWVNQGDLIIGMDGDFNIRHWKGDRALLNQRLCCLKRRSNTNMDFVGYVLQFPLRVINDLTYSTTVKHLSSNDIMKICVGIPPEHEQKTIVKFLDSEIAKIDALVEKKERLIELLQEKRTAMIAQAVTKGLDPNAPMKDSGVDWLGEIPANWDVRRLKYLASINDEALSEKTDPQFEMIYVDIGGVDKDKGIIEREEHIFETAPSRARRVVRDGDVIVSTVRTYLRAITPIRAPECNLIVSTGFAVIRPASGLDSDYAAYALRATYFVENIVANSTGVSYPAIEASKVSSFSITFPELMEQQRIAAFLDRETGQIDKLISRIREAITNLNDYRAAFMSSAVTGKIDVRSIVP
jgi:type I restriction enzyme S subunit